MWTLFFKITENKNISLYRLIFFVRENIIPPINIKTKDISNILLKKLPTLKNPNENFYKTQQIDSKNHLEEKMCKNSWESFEKEEWDVTWSIKYRNIP